jgi:hypothetical protein
MRSVTASGWSRSVAGIATSRRWRIAFLAAALCATPWAPLACGQRVLRNHFDDGAEGWQIYDYDGGHAGNVFYPVTWGRTGGVDDSGYVWADDSRWRIDTPETPNSILAFIFSPSWVKGDPLDLRDAKVSVYLRGDGLDLKWAKVYFWAFDQEIGTRWHYTAEPLEVTEGAWGKKLTFTLRNDEKAWSRSWARDPGQPASLEQVLSDTDGYGFSFVGFDGEVTGKFSMDELDIQLREN